RERVAGREFHATVAPAADGASFARFQRHAGRNASAAPGPRRSSGSVARCRRAVCGHVRSGCWRLARNVDDAGHGHTGTRRSHRHATVEGWCGAGARRHRRRQATASDAHRRARRGRRRGLHVRRGRQPAARRRLGRTDGRCRPRRGRRRSHARRRHAGARAGSPVIQLFRVRGIPVRIDAGWLLIFGLVTWSLAAGYFPHVLPARSTATYWLQGVAAALLLFGSVFLHELSHALAAVDQGVPVGGITLHVFGGVSQLDAEPPTPRAEMLIAVVGPLTSFAIGGLCLVADRTVEGPPAFHALVGYLAAINLMVGVFNLVPGFPLAGGRILRAAVWWGSGRLAHATRIASHCGSAVALLLIALGAARALTGDLIGGLWLTLLGLFLHQTARSSWELMRVRARL